MRLVYEQPVYAQLLKGNHIVLSLSCPEFLQSRLQSFPGLFHLFDGETFAILGFHLSNGVFDFINLGSQNPLLPFCGHRNFLKLGMPDDDCIVITSSNSCAELLSAGSFKVLFACHQQFCTRIQTQKLVCPLKGQMIRNDKHGFLAQSQPFCLHSRSGHLESLTGTHFVGQQRIAAVQHMSNGILLVFPQPDFRIHAAKADMRTIILTRTGTVEQLVILFHKFRAAIRVFPHPVLECILNGLLFLLGEGGLLFIQNPLLLAVCILHGIVNTNIPQIQRILQNSVGIGTAGAVGHIGMNIIPARCILRFFLIQFQVLRVGNRSLRQLNDDCQLFRGQALGMYHFTDFAVFLLVVLSVPFLSALLPFIAFPAGFLALRSNLFQFQAHIVSFPGE